MKSAKAAEARVAKKAKKESEAARMQLHRDEKTVVHPESHEILDNLALEPESSDSEDDRNLRKVS